MKYKKLIVFDFDGTLCHTVGQEEGVKIWKDVTGTDWSYAGWWGKSETLDDRVFHTPINQWVYKKYLESIADNESFVILATGRLEKVAGMRKNIEKILNYHNISFDTMDDGKNGIYLNNMGDTFRFKTKLFQDLANELGVEELIMYDDRHEHLVKFWEWSKKQSFNVNVIDVVNKTNKTFSNIK